MKRNILTVAAIIFFVYFISQHITDTERLIFLINEAKWWYVLMALGTQLLYYTLFVFLYKESLEIYEVKWSFKQIAPMVLISLAVGIVTPLGYWAGIGVLLYKAQQEQIPRASVSTGVFLATLFDLLALFLLLSCSMLILMLRQDIYFYEVFGYIVFAGLVLGALLSFILGIMRPEILTKILTFFQKQLNLLSQLTRRKDALEKDWGEKRSKQIANLSTRLITQRQRLRKLVFYSFSMHLTNIITLFLLFLSFGEVIGGGALLSGYSIGRLFLIISPTPQGIGFVESIMPIVFTSQGIGAEVATLATLTFRGLTLWLPVLIGFTLIGHNRLYNSKLFKNLQNIDEKNTI